MHAYRIKYMVYTCSNTLTVNVVAAAHWRRRQRIQYDTLVVGSAVRTRASAILGQCRTFLTHFDRARYSNMQS